MSLTQKGMHDSWGSKSKEEGVSSNARPLLKRVEHFLWPATFQSIEIDLFVMKGDPFRILRACNLCEMGVSPRKTGRQRLKNYRGKESGRARDWDENRPIVFIWSLSWLSKMNLDRLLSWEQHHQAVTADKRLLLHPQAFCIFMWTQDNGGKIASIMYNTMWKLFSENLMQQRALKQCTETHVIKKLSQ